MKILTDFGYISLRWIWVALTILFSVIEVFTFGLTTVWFAIAAFVMIFVSFLNIPLLYQALIFLVISTTLLIFTRPVALRKFKVGREKTNVDSLVGKHALVVKPIGEFDKGEVKLQGQIWSARSEDGSTIDENTKCEVVRIEGVHAIVRKITIEEINSREEKT
ncbi:MAG: NfeD family protein [Treponema sp.]|jgi:membrane protein implicated in regulation of membrane protease activity|nr:NfeD family protein [Treponema sp.]